jgi:transposase-like protein
VRTITVDKNAAYPVAVTAMKRDGELWRFSRLRQVKYLNNIVEQDHRRIKRLVRPGLGFGSLPTARRTLAGYEGMAMIRKGQVRNIGGAICGLRPPSLLACSGLRLDLGLATALPQPASTVHDVFR